MKTIEEFTPTRLLAAGLMAALLAGTAAGQPEGSAPQKPDDKTRVTQPTVRRTRPVRKSVVDLEAQARERRPGQVMPGDPPPYAAGAPAPTPRIQTRPDGTLDLPSAASPAGAVVTPSATDAPAVSFSDRALGNAPPEPAPATMQPVPLAPSSAAQVQPAPAGSPRPRA